MKNILVIDDEQIVVKTISRFLESHGYNVVVAQSGDEALGKVQKENFDLIISDIRMPGMSGVETLQKIREKHQQQNNFKVPTVVITGYSGDDAEKQASQLGVVDFLYKPFELDEFYSVIKRNLETKPVYRRAHPRVLASFPLALELKNPSFSEPSLMTKGETLNLSEGGFCISTESQLPVSSFVKIKMDFTPVKPAIEVEALVVWVDHKKEKNIFHYGLKFCDLEENVDSILKEILIKYLFLDERFVALTSDTEIYFQNVMNRFDKLDESNPSEKTKIDFITNNKKNIFKEFDRYFKDAWETVKDFDKHRYLVHQAYYHQKLKDLFLRAETNRYVYEKPLGYPGDYVMMNYIIDYYGDTRYLGKSSFEKLINNYTCNIPISSSNINRKDFFKQKILDAINGKDDARITSVGSGPARELIELLKEKKITKRLFFTCLDLEKKALGYVKNELEKIGLEKAPFLSIGYIHRDVLAIIRDEKLKEDIKNQDLIYASGLFDYLRPNMASRLTKELYQLLAPKGELIICNASLNNATHRAYYELLGGWNLIYRTKEEMLEWTNSIGPTAKIKFEDFTDRNNYLLMSIKKI